MRRATTARNAWTKSKQYERKRKDTRWVLWELVVLLQRRRILGTDWYGVLALVEKKGWLGISFIIRTSKHFWHFLIGTCESLCQMT